MIKNFAYTDEEDKCYGITGMVLTLNVFDSEDKIHEISLDAEDGETISFTPDFFFSSNPRFSAKIAWNEALKQYQILTGMVIGNILSRYVVKNHKSLTASVIDDIKDLVSEEGREICQLDDDEIDTVFRKTLNYLSNIYSNRQVHLFTTHFADVIRARRSLTGNDVRDELSSLR